MPERMPLLGADTGVIAQSYDVSEEELMSKKYLITY
jgi:hypothetical protein